MLNKIILVCFILLAGLVILILLSNRDSQGSRYVTSSSGGVYNAQLLGTSNQGQNTGLLGFSQRDPGQYSNVDEYKTWSPSACSAAAIASIFSNQGKSVRTTDILAIMRDRKAITASSGLFDYSVFNTVASRYNLRADLNESRDLDSHFNRILDYLSKGTPVLINVQDRSFFPNGHFIAAFRLNPDNTVTVTNSDPEPGRPVVQDWPIDALKTYFSRTYRSVAFLGK